jgi:hypothetical protein
MKFRFTSKGKPILFALLVVTFILFSSVQLAPGNGGTVTSISSIQPSSAPDRHPGSHGNKSEVAHPDLGSFSVSITPTNSILDIGQSVTFTASPSGTYIY